MILKTKDLIKRDPLNKGLTEVDPENKGFKAVGREKQQFAGRDGQCFRTGQFPDCVLILLAFLIFMLILKTKDLVKRDPENKGLRQIDPENKGFIQKLKRRG